MTKSPPIPLILFPGLAANAEVFAPQRLAFPHLVVPRWPVPKSGETLDDYARRIAEGLAVSRPCIVGGLSFGGIVAQEVARHLKPRFLALVSTVRDPRELPLYARMSRPLRFTIPWLPVRLLQLLAYPLTARAVGRIAPTLSGIARQFCAADRRVLKWSLARLLDWDSPADVDCPVYHIGGSRDFMLPSRLTTRETIVEGGGHLITLTHAREVNDWLRNIVGES